ncbi:suppressor of fused domain protein [Paraclostridium ghonii]|uniref:suppressor of fused domain protein n=1 Tax=Paraclostridium ghonii TaxID=29358 RepID=UPI00202CF8A2|nr:suppressor of fused domain protein [Paeniclostridium ghonii]MCM0167872.1 suppressor of fused domain protein [Paeniclostridium ghonii]
MDINKIIAKKELEVIGGKPQVHRYWDEKHKKSVDILSCVDRPYTGVISYGTIGLSGYDIRKVSDNKNLRLELLGACDIEEELFANILATTAFEIMEKGNCGYGHIISDVIAQYVVGSDMKHIYLMNAFLWEGFNTLEFENKKVAWLLIIPISGEEKKYALDNGYDALETKFEEMDIDIFNLRRKSVL